MPISADIYIAPPIGAVTTNGGLLERRLSGFRPNSSHSEPTLKRLLGLAQVISPLLCRLVETSADAIPKFHRDRSEDRRPFDQIDVTALGMDVAAAVNTMSGMPAVAYAASAFLRTRWLAGRLKTPNDVHGWQAKRLATWFKTAVPRIEAFAGARVARLEQLPPMNKEVLNAAFAEYNLPRISADEVRAAIDVGADRVRGYPVGQSTGTSGNRGYFVISDAERFVWLGTILAKALPDILWRRHRVALALPGFSTLYRSAERGRRIALRFFDLGLGVDAWADDLVAFAPDTIVAPPKVLRRLAESGRLTARHIFSGAEVLDPLDRAVIEAATGGTVREIYMATEGLLGVSCPLGTLHLAEDAVKFEWQPCGDSGMVTPLITDFTRQTQIMARYRMNDLLALSNTRCRCGSPLQAGGADRGAAGRCIRSARHQRRMADDYA